MARRAREWGGRLLLVVISLFLSVAALEGAARTLVWSWTREPGVVRHPFARFDPELGWSKPPNVSGILRRSEYRASLRINSRGLRGPEIPLDKPKGVPRVLLLGDSFTEGYTVEEPASVRGRLERGLASALSAPVQVINGGTAGWGTDQEVLFYEKAGRAYGPDLVVLLCYYNDLYRDGDLRIQPWFDLDEAGSLVLNNSPVPPHGEFYRAEPFSIKPFHASMASPSSSRGSTPTPAWREPFRYLGSPILRPRVARSPTSSSPSGASARARSDATGRHSQLSSSGWPPKSRKTPPAS